jgi:hypothetical protein
LQQIRDWGKKIVLVVNKVDILTDEQQRAQVMEFVSQAANKLVGEISALFPVSAKLAQQAKAGKPQLWQASGFEALESFVHDVLDDDGRFRLKLLNPLGVGLRLVRQQVTAVEADLDSLQADRQLLSDIERQMVYYNEDMQRNFQARMGEMNNVLLGMENRGDQFFDEMIRFGRIPDLMRSKKVEAAFEAEVIGDTPRQIEGLVDEMIDWLVTQDLRQWTAVAEHMAQRKESYDNRVVGQAGPKEGSLAYDRKRLIDSIGQATERAVETYNREKEAELIAEAARTAVVNTGLAGLGVGLGVAIAAAAHVVWLDVTGILAGVTAAALGLVILPARRRSAKRELEEKLDTMRQDLVNGLTDQFDREMRRGAQRIEDTIAPFARFVRAETDRLTDLQERMVALEAHILGLQAELGVKREA